MTAALTPEQRIEALEAELAACKRDAERWRYAISEGQRHSVNWLAVYCDWDGEGSFTDAIDAAMAAGEPK